MTALPAPPHTSPQAGRFILLAMLGVLGGIILGQHAVTRHGSEATRIRECLDQNGPDQIWQSTRDPDVRAFCVQIDEDAQGCGVFGILIAQLFPGHGCRYRERTSFVPKNRGQYGTEARMTRYLERSFERVK